MTTIPAQSVDRKITQINPTYAAFNEEAENISRLLLRQLRLPHSGPKSAKYMMMVASVVHAAKIVLQRLDKEKKKPRSKQRPVQLGMAVGNDNWSRFPDVGSTIGVKTLKAFESHGLLGKDPDSGKREFYTTDNGKLAYQGIMTCWSVTPAFKKLLKNINPTFVETGRPLLFVNKVETRGQKASRERLGKAKVRLSRPAMVSLFGGDVLNEHEARLEKIASYWAKHPLVLPDGNAAASASRVFSDSSLKVGGRLYGAWTTLKDTERLKCTIDGEAVVQLDISASQPTLLSALLGVKMNNLSEKDGWCDPYTHLTGLWCYGATADQREEERIAVSERSKQIAKKVIMELIGTGNVEKAHPSDEFVASHQVTQSEWDYFKAKLREAIPALEKLEPRWGEEGRPTGYVNGAGFLAYHESEIMLQTLEVLRDEWDVSAYPVHDCLIVKVSDWEIAYSIFVQTICSYVEGMTGTKVIVPIKREGGGLPNITFRGVYDSNSPQHLIL